MTANTASQVQGIIANGSSADLNSLGPEEFCARLAEILPCLAQEYSNIHLQISASNIDQFISDMERGVTLDTVFQRLSDGAAPQDIAQNLDPKKYKLTNRIRVYKAFYKSVTLDMNARDASDIGRKLSAGVSTRGCSVDEIIALLAE